MTMTSGFDLLRKNTADIPEECIIFDQEGVDPNKVRPIQMGELLRKYVSRRLLALSEGELAAEIEAAKIFEVGQRSLERLLPGFTQGSLEQATPSASQSSIWVLEGAGRCQPSTPRSSECCQTTDSGHDDPRCDYSRSHPETTFVGAPGRNH